MKAKKTKLDREIEAVLLENAIVSSLRGEGRPVLTNKLKGLVETALGHKVHMTVFVNTLLRMVVDKRVERFVDAEDIRPRWQIGGRR